NATPISKPPWRAGSGLRTRSVSPHFSVSWRPPSSVATTCFTSSPLATSGLTELGLVTFHASTLRRAVLNLVQHALDAMPSGGTVTLAGRGTATHVQRQVRETGSGLLATGLGRIFEPLFTTKPGGTGRPKRRHTSQQPWVLANLARLRGGGMFQILEAATLMRLLDAAPEAVHDTIETGGWTGCLWPGHPEWEMHEACVQIRSLALHYFTVRHPAAEAHRHDVAAQLLAS